MISRAPILFMGQAFTLSVDWSLFYLGPEIDPSWNIHAISLQGSGPEFEATGELFNVLSRLRIVDEAILARLGD